LEALFFCGLEVRAKEEDRGVDRVVIWEVKKSVESRWLGRERLRTSRNSEAILIEKFYLQLGTLLSPGTILS
jgi:hypothetical protein